MGRKNLMFTLLIFGMCQVWQGIEYEWEICPECRLKQKVNFRYKYLLKPETWALQQLQHCDPTTPASAKLQLSDLVSPQQCCSGFSSSGMWRRVVGWAVPDVSKEFSAFNFSVTRSGPLPWRRRDYEASKLQELLTQQPKRHTHEVSNLQIKVACQLLAWTSPFCI
jgi:hypothetical protein